VEWLRHRIVRDPMFCTAIRVTTPCRSPVCLMVSSIILTARSPELRRMSMSRIRA
jgi:hypothetical protein